MVAPVAAPLILALVLPRDLFDRLDARRRAYYPPARNRVPAHLTLFHHLPGPQAPRLAEDLRAEMAAALAPELWLSGLVSLGRGVAVRVESPALLELRARLAARWEALLVPQDRAAFRPHVTLANKLAPSEARRLLSDLSARFRPERAIARGLALYAYRPDGRWAELETRRFRP